jgi:chromate transporter
MTEAAPIAQKPVETGQSRVSSGATGHGVTFGEAFLVWARVALLSFGGPAGQIAVMHRIIVEEKRWVSENRFLHALNYCHLLPGPEAQQLAIYIGWLMHRTRGGLVAGILFVVPGVIALMALSWIYVIWGDVSVVAGLFFGLKAAVVAVVVQAVLRVGRRALKSRIAIAIAGLAFVALFFFAVPFPVVVLAAAAVGFTAGRLGFPVGNRASHGPAKLDAEDADLLGDEMPAHARPDLGRAVLVAAVWLILWLAPVVLLLVVMGPQDVFTRLSIFFSQVALFSFGGAYAVLTYVAQQAVANYHWLKPAEMLAGLGMAETTPGPLIMVVQHVGFLAGYRSPDGLPPLLAGTLAGLLVTWVTFTPCFLWVFLGAPYVEALRGARALSAALSAVTAAVVGVIMNLAIWFALHTWFREAHPIRAVGLSFDAPIVSSVDPWALALSVAAIIAIFRFKTGMIPTLLACAVAGVILNLVDAF